MAHRASKKQLELFQFIDTFISQHGYGPSYREIMTGLNYKSVSTVAVHVNALVSLGYLTRKDGSARSLEVSSRDAQASMETKADSANSTEELTKILEQRIKETPLTQEQQAQVVEVLQLLKITIKLPESDPSS